jgi:hypothetical protein
MSRGTTSQDFGLRKCVRGVSRGADLEPLVVEKNPERLASIRVVVHDEYAPATLVGAANLSCKSAPFRHVCN